MSAQRYFGDDMALKIETTAGTPTEIVVASLKGVTVTLSAEHVDLYSADSIEREDVKKRQLEVPVEVSIAAFDVALMQGWMAGDSTTTATSVTDTSDVATFTLTGTLTPAGGGSDLKAVVEEVYFPEMPVMDASEGEWVVHDLSGKGKTISSLTEVTA